jgi:hypothetical protein
VSRKKGDVRLARLRTLIQRAQDRCRPRAADLQRAHAWLLDIARRLEPEEVTGSAEPETGAQVRRRVEAALDEMAARLAAGDLPEWLRPPLEHVITVLRRLGHGLYHCYDIPGLPRTDNDLEQFYRRVKSLERRITGHKRSDTFIVRLGGFAVYAVAASTESDHALLPALAAVPAVVWQRQRDLLRATQRRQTQMRRFRLHRAAYLADLEARWTLLTEPP